MTDKPEDKAIEAAWRAYERYDGDDAKGLMQAAITAYNQARWQDPKLFEQDGNEVIAWLKSDTFADTVSQVIYDKENGWCWTTLQPIRATVHKVQPLPTPPSEV